MAVTQIRTAQIQDLAVTAAKIALSGTFDFATAGGTVRVSTPSASTDAANKTYVDNSINGLDWKQSVRVATTVNGTLATAYENGDTVDGVVLVTGNRILLKNQTTGADNGIYTVNASGAPTRSTDLPTGDDAANIAVFIE